MGKRKDWKDILNKRIIIDKAMAQGYIYEFWIFDRKHNLEIK